jgi:hypothetical protein
MKFDSPSDTIEGVINRMSRVTLRGGTRRKNYRKALPAVYFSPVAHPDIAKVTHEISAGNDLPQIKQVVTECRWYAGTCQVFREDAQRMFGFWYRVRDSPLRSDGFACHMLFQRATMQAALQRGSACREAKTTCTCRASICPAHCAVWLRLHAAKCAAHIDALQ